MCSLNRLSFLQRASRLPIFVVALLAFTVTAQAQSLFVYPTELRISAASPVTDLVLRNDGAEETTIQLDIKAWQQVGGQDQLLPSGRLLVHPENLRLQPGESGRVKVALKLSGPRWEEQAFQVLLTEIPRIPDMGSATGYSSEGRVTRRSSIPVFLSPPGAANPMIAWEVTRSTDGGVLLKASNSGRAHVQLSSATLAGPDGQHIEMFDLASVILPGGSRSWRLMDSAVGGLWQLTADTSAGQMKAELELEPGLSSSRNLSLAE